MIPWKLFCGFIHKKLYFPLVFLVIQMYCIWLFSKMHLDCKIILTEQQHLKCKEDIWRHLLDPKISWSTIEILTEQTFFWYLFKIFYLFQWSFLFLHPQKSGEVRQNATAYCTWSGVFQQPNAKAQLIKWSLAHCPQKNPTCWPRTINWGSFFAGMLVCLKNYWQSGYNQLILWVRSCVWVNQVEVH